jgi:catechol 2,3-dioxygenase-like lactoylglutathione lyase family enzyme
MRIGHLELFVRDPERSRSFYEQVLGFEVTAVQGRNVWLMLGDAEILLRLGSGAEGGPSYASAATGIVLYVDDLPAARERLASRGLKFEAATGAKSVRRFVIRMGIGFSW